ncbi:hypothetical protein OXPF_39540 [Oxobacter pfennigii]|uniref:Uncharacterized protein n=1 Tax=Oxobacter pfennigii TaxID=36849 RepID=A0A0P8W427_9CLOT|nr:hypothetical protein OXPF_39540 [Oxobacter pfennigii]
MDNKDNVYALIYAILTPEVVPIDKILRKFNLLPPQTRKPKTRTFTQGELANIRRLREQGIIYQDIANTYGVSLYCIWLKFNKRKGAN